MQTIAVFVGANSGNAKKYKTSTELLAKQIAQTNLRLVYGGANVGLMGLLADTALGSGVEVIGVIPESLQQHEIAHPNLTKLHIVDSMHARKSMMAHLADAFIALPGGLGTLEEIFETWNAIKIGTLTKPLGLLNVDGFFDPLLQFLDTTVAEGFVTQAQLDLVKVNADPEVLLNSLGITYERTRPNQSLLTNV